MDFKDILEQEIDAKGLLHVLNELATICYEKAEHVRSNWQDKLTAREWERQAAAIERTLHKVR